VIDQNNIITLKENELKALATRLFLATSTAEIGTLECPL